MEWDGSLETGHRLVDDQHRELFVISDQISEVAQRGCDASTLDDLLLRLSLYVSTHFSAEEELMGRYAYPVESTNAHRREHEDLSARTRELVLAHRTGETPTVLELVALLQDWLAVHISEADTEFVGYLRAQHRC